MVPLLISRRKASKHSEATNELANTTSLDSQVYYSVSPSANRAEKASATQISKTTGKRKRKKYGKKTNKIGNLDALLFAILPVCS